MNTEATRMRAKRFSTREEQLETLPQLRADFPLLKEAEIPKPSAAAAPKIISDLLAGHEFWRVEWFVRGMVLITESEKWRDFLCVSRRKVSNKIMCTGGFLWEDAMMRVWSDSLYYPDTIIWYEGMAWYSEEIGLVKQRVSMVSHVYDLDHVVTGMIVEAI